MGIQKKDGANLELIPFCPACFASSENGSWSYTVMGDFCSNCGAIGTITIPRWAIESIRHQASWVGRRYYPNQEDRENAAELRALRAIPKSFPGRTAQQDKEDKYRYWVTQRLDSNKTVSTSVKAASVDDAIEASRYVLPYVPEEQLNDREDRGKLPSNATASST